MTESTTPEPVDPLRRMLKLALDDAEETELVERDPDPSDFSDAALLDAALNPELEPLDRFLGRATRVYVAEVLRRTGGGRTATARILGIDRTTLYRLMKRHGIHG